MTRVVPEGEVYGAMETTWKAGEQEKMLVMLQLNSLKLLSLNIGPYLELGSWTLELSATQAAPSSSSSTLELLPLEL